VLDRAGVEKAEVVVIVSPGRLGTAAEIGIALGRRIPIIIYNMSSRERLHSVYANDPAITHVDCVDELLYHLDMMSGADKR